MFVEPTGFGIARSPAARARLLSHSMQGKGLADELMWKIAAAKAAVRHFNSTSAMLRNFPRSRNLAGDSSGKKNRLGIPYEFRNPTLRGIEIRDCSTHSLKSDK